MKKALSLFLALILMCGSLSLVTTAASAPAAPKLAGIRNSGKGIVLTWKAVKGVSSYIVYRKTASTKWAKIATPKGASTVTYVDANVKSGTAYTYTVRSYKNKLGSSYDKKGLTYTFLTSPQLLSAANSRTGVVVKWGPAKGATAYYLYRKGSSGWNRIAIITDSRSYIDKAASKGKTNTYTVIACRGKYASSYYSKGVSCLYLAPNTFTEVSKNASDNTLKWNAVAGAKGYIVYRRTAGSSWSVLTKTTARQYVDTAIDPGKIYAYAVRAYNGSVKNAYDAVTPWDFQSTAGVFEFYRSALNSVKLDGGAGYKLSVATKGSDFQAVGYPSFSSLIGSVIEKEMNKTETSTVTKGSKDATENFPPCTLTDFSKIKMRSITDKGSYYQIKLVFVDENAKTRKDGFLWQASNLIVYTDELVAELSAGGESFDGTIDESGTSIVYPNYTITANISKNGEFLSLSHQVNASLEITMTSGSITLPLTGKLLETASYSAFTY